jgi:hypothetical protein
METAVPLTPPLSQIAATDTSGNSIKRNSPGAFPVIDSITIEDDSEDGEQPAKKIRLHEPANSAHVTMQVTENGAAGPAGPMDWKPAVSVIDIVELSSDDEV